MKNTKVCAVRYLNTVPLIWGIQHGRQRGIFELSYATPSVCADSLAGGEADIGIVPVVEVERLRLDVVPGIGIASQGPVRSILLFSKCHPEQIKTLAVDSSSRTSLMLARIVLRQRYGADAAVISRPPRLEEMLEVADAALIIGDPALRLNPAELSYHVLDLGQEWNEMTGLPMVFALWAGRKGCVTPDVVRAFEDSCRFGRSHLSDIVQLEAAARRIPAELAQEYLTRHIVFELGDRERQGMQLFLRYAASLPAQALGLTAAPVAN